MDKDEVVALIRCLLSSTTSTYNIPRLLKDFREEAGVELPRFGYRTTSEFLKSIPDTVKLVGEYPNEEVRLVLSEKSAHVVELVDNQKANTKRRKRPSRPSFGGRPRPPPRRDAPPRRDFQSGRDRGPPRNSTANIRSFSSSQPFRSRSPENLPVYVNSYDQEKLYDFLQEHPEGVSFDEVTKLMLGRNETWSKYRIKYGIPELIEFCSAFSVIHADKVYSLDNYRNFMRSNKIEVANGCSFQPAGNESSHSEDGFYDDDEYEDEYYEVKSTSSVPKNVQKKESEPCDINTFKTRLKEIIKKYPEGIWCTDLLELYEQFFDEKLKFQHYGYTSLIHMLLEMPEVVSCSQPGDGDWKIYDASNRMKNVSDVLQNIKQNLLEVLNSKNGGIQEKEIPALYYKLFKERLNFYDFGYDDLGSFLRSVENELFIRKKCDNKEMLLPKFQMILLSNYDNQKSRSGNASSSRPSSDELYPEEVVGLNERLPELDIKNFAKVGEYVEVCVGEVWSPHKFYLQLRKFKNDLTVLMNKLQTWYNNFKHVHKMPEKTLLPEQVCVALYQLNPDLAEWHRAVIKKKVDDETVLVSLVDYGTITKINKKRLRFLHKDFSSLPIQALMARLANIVPKGSPKWSNDASQRFLDLVFDKDLVAGVVEIDYKKNSMSVALSYTQGTEIHIADTLEAEGYALFIEDATPQSAQSSQQPSGPKRSMKPDVGFKPEPEVIFEIDEPEDIVEIIKTKTEAPEKPKKSDKPQSGPSQPTQHALSSEEIAAALVANPLLASNPLSAANTLLNPSLTPYSNLLNETQTLGVNPLQQNLLAQTMAQNTNPTGNLLQQFANLSLLGSMQMPQAATSRAPPGFSPARAPLSEQERKEKINSKVLEILISQPQVNAIAKADMTLALQVATTIAEEMIKKEQMASQPPPLVPNGSYMNFQNPSLNLQNPNLSFQNPSLNLENPNLSFQNPIVNLQSPNANFQNPNVALVHPQAVSPPSKANPGPKRKIQIQLGDDDFKSNVPNILPDIVKNMEKKISASVYKMEVKEKPIHVISLDDQLFVLTEEVIKRFTPFSDKDIVDKVLDCKKITFQYKSVTPMDLAAYKEIERWNIQRVPSKGNKFTLLPLKSLIKYIRSMVRIDDGTTLAIYQFIENCESELKQPTP